MPPCGRQSAASSNLFGKDAQQRKHRTYLPLTRIYRHKPSNRIAAVRVSICEIWGFWRAFGDADVSLLW